MSLPTSPLTTATSTSDFPIPEDDCDRSFLNYSNPPTIRPANFLDNLDNSQLLPLHTALAILPSDITSQIQQLENSNKIQTAGVSKFSSTTSTTTSKTSQVASDQLKAQNKTREPSSAFSQANPLQ